MKLKNAVYATQETKKVARFIGAALDAQAGGADVKTAFDSVAAESGVEQPKNFSELVGKMPEGAESQVLGAIYDGVEAYTAAHGEGPRADMIEAALQQGLAAFNPVDINGRPLFDSATSNAHDQISLQPNRAVTAIIRTIAEALPFAGYLPVDIGSNQSKLIIAQTLAGSAFGDYAVGGSLEGIQSGGNYALGCRFATLSINGGGNPAPLTVQFFTRNLVTGEPDPASTAMAILRGRTQIYVDGIPAATEPNKSVGATSPLNGSVTIAGTTYTLAGTVTPTTGAASVGSTPALPAGTHVYAEAFIDFDTAPALIPLVSVIATTYDIYATENRIYTANAFGAASQMRNEAGIDPETLATVKFQDQHTSERHYKALRQARIQGSRNNTRTFNFSFATRGTQLTRASIMQDLAAELGAASQKMANDTQDHGITHCYTGAYFASILEGCPDNIFKPSGVPKRAGIYKIGTLFNRYEMYYAPKVVIEALDGTASELLCVGVSSQPARNPFLAGDAVPPTLLPLAMNPDLKRQAAFYVRDFMQMNPHEISARGCALITITNLQPAP